MLETCVGPLGSCLPRCLRSDSEQPGAAQWVECWGQWGHRGGDSQVGAAGADVDHVFPMALPLGYHKGLREGMGVTQHPGLAGEGSPAAAGAGGSRAAHLHTGGCVQHGRLTFRPQAHVLGGCFLWNPCLECLCQVLAFSCTVLPAESETHF